MQANLQENSTGNAHIIESNATARIVPNSEGSLRAYQTLGRKYFPALCALEEVQLFRQQKADILSAAQILVLKTALSPAKLEKSGFLQLCQGFEILNKAERLELGKSSENHAHTIFGSVNIQLPSDK